MFDGSNVVFTAFSKEVPKFLNIPLSKVMKLVNESNEDLVDAIMHLYLGHPIAFKLKLKNLTHHYQYTTITYCRVC